MCKQRDKKLQQRKMDNQIVHTVIRELTTIGKTNS